MQLFNEGAPQLPDVPARGGDDWWPKDGAPQAPQGSYSQFSRARTVPIATGSLSDEHRIFAGDKYSSLCPKS